MMRHIATSVFVLGACVALAAQAPTTAPGAYESAAEATVSGIITAVMPTTGADGTVGVHLDLATATGASMIVHLGPALFIGMNDASFFADDQILVTGAFVSHEGGVALWARQITKNGKTLVLRNTDGTPRWLSATDDDRDGCGIAHAPVRD
jgi:hypothetical protein